MANSKKLQRNTQEELSDSVVEEMVRQRAYEIYESHGREDGHDIDDWLEAEAEIRREIALPAAA